jgi:Mrp family chromosome partitioning ATPase/capsular polysaccharide biosynthesis protein
MAEAQAGSDLAAYAAVLRRQLWVILLLAAISLAAGLGYSLRQQPVYSSSASVLVRSGNLFPTNPSSSPALVNMHDEQQVATSLAVADLAREKIAKSVGNPASMSVSSQENTNSLVFKSSSLDPVAASKTAQAFAEAYLDHRRSQVLGDLRAAGEPIDDRIDALNDQIAKVEDELAQNSKEPQRTSLQIQLNSLLVQRSSLEQTRDQLILPQNLRVGEILHPALVPAVPSNRNHKRAAALALVVGLALGVGVAFIRDRLDLRLHDAADAEESAGLPVLAVIPRQVARWPFWRKDTRESAGAVAEAYRTLRTKLLSAERGPDPLRTLVVTSSAEHWGKAAVTAQLGVALTKVDQHVIIVSTDMRQSRLLRIFGVRRRDEPLSLTSRQGENGASVPSWTHHVQSVGNNLLLLDAGPLLHSPDLLGTRAMRDLLKELTDFADTVLVEAAAVVGMSDALAVGPATDGVILVEELGSATREAVLEARRQLDEVGARTIGLALVEGPEPPDISAAARAPGRWSHYEKKGPSNLDGAADPGVSAPRWTREP